MSITTCEPRCVQAGGGIEYMVLGSPTVIKLSSDQTGGLATLAEISAQPGIGVPLHYHVAEDETFYILAGAMKFTVNGRELVAQAGETVYGPRGIPHSWFATGNTLARMLVWVTPGGIDRMFHDLSNLGPNGKMQDVLAICANYQIYFPNSGGPDPAAAR